MKRTNKSEQPSTVPLPFVYRTYVAPPRMDFDEWINSIELPVGSPWELTSIDVAARAAVMRRPRQDK